MSVDVLLSKLTKVKQTARGNWVACCPAHNDKNPSMTVREMDDGRVLVHCFAECSVEDVLASIGLEFDALFPPNPLADHIRPTRRSFPAADVLEALATETLVVVATAARMRNGSITPEDMERLVLAASRIESARRLALG